MQIEIQWHSLKGTRTPDNRDFAGIGIRGNAVLCIVLDGSTSGPNSGDFARDLACAVVDWYVATNETVSPDLLISQLRRIHEHFSQRFPRDSASYIIVHTGADGAFLLHAGDCALGYQGDKQAIDWWTQPHTLATAFGQMPLDQLAKVPARHLLTRSFRSAEFIAPETSQFDLQSGTFVAATDGFWAELGQADQALFMDDQFIATERQRDDRSALRCRFTTSKGFTVAITGDRASPNLYCRQTLS